MADDVNRLLEDAQKRGFLDDIAKVLERDKARVVCIALFNGAVVPGYGEDIDILHYNIQSGMEMRGILATVLTDTRLDELKLINNRRGV